MVVKAETPCQETGAREVAIPISGAEIKQF
jgi:hypothetical protein